MRNYLITLAMAIALLIASCQVATAQQTTLLNETFNNISSGVPTNWDNSDNDCGSSYCWQSDASGYNGTRGMKFNTYSASSGTYSTLKTPTLNLNQAYYLKFKYQNYSAGQLDVYISLDGGATYTTAIATNLTTATSSEWAEVEYSLSAYQGNSNVKIVFKGISNWGYQRQYLDDVVIESAPTCKNPSGIYVSNLTTTTATLNWSLSQDGDVPTYFELRVTDPNGTDVVNSTTVPGTSLSYALTGLTANTTYTVSMRGDCNATLGGYSKYETYSFTTACNTTSIPYTENFDGLSGTPDCTTSLNCSINSSYKYGTSGKSLQMSTTASNSAYMVFPLLNHAANDLEVSFMLRGYNTSTPIAFQVGVVGDAADIEGTFEPLYIDSALGTTWTEVRMNTTLSSYTTSPSEICIFVGSGTSASIYIDDVSIHTIPTCIRPEQFRAYNPTATSVDLTWTTSTATQHIIYITDANSNVTRQVVTTNPYTVTGLQPNSSYSFNLRALCTPTDSSEMASATATATTLCMPQASAIWSEGAEGTSTTATIPNCWQVGYFNYPSSSYTSYTDPITTQSSTKHSGSRGFQLRDMYSGTISYLTSQGFTVDSANKYQASIWVYRTSGTSSNGEGIRLYVSTQPDNVTGAEELGFINRCAGNSPVETAGTGWYNYTYPIATTGTVYLIIQGESKYGSYTYFDDISVELAPTCLVPGDITMGTATMTDVAISWTAGASNETSWVLAYELLSGSTVVSSDSLTVTTPSYTVTGLAAASSYTLRARVYALCSPTDMSAAKSASSSFTTPCATITTLPYSQDFEAMTTGTTPTCWDISASTSSSASSNASYIWGVYNYSSNNSLRMYNYLARSGTALINTPTIVLPTQAAELLFKYSNRANCGDLYVKISTDNGATFVDLGNYSSSGSTSQTDPGTFTQETIDLYSYAGQSVIIQFFANANYGSGSMFIDDVVVRLAPTCRDIVGGATVYDIKPNSARVSISDTSVTDWDICYGPTGTAAGAGTIINVSGRMDTIITGLTNGSSYVVYVRRNCGATDLGAWTITPVTFTCSCTPATATISQVNARDAVVTATAADWELCYGPSGTTTSTGTIVPVTGSATYNLTGLTPSTNYVAYVRHNCGNSEYSDWSSAYNFQTTSIPDSLPFGTGFESSADDGGWHFVNGSSTSNVFTIGSDANGVCSGSRALYMSNNSSYGYSNSSSTKTYAYRTIYFPEGTTHLSFNWKCTGGESSYDFGRVMLVPASETLTGGTGSYYSNVTFPNYIRAFDPAGANKMNLTTGDANGWNLYETDITLSTDSAGTYNFVIMWSNDGSVGNQYPIAIDNISISQVTCNVPTVLASALTANGGTVTATSQETQNIEVVVSSTAIDIYSTVTGDLYQGVTSAPVVITSMQPNTPFYYTARAICGPGDTSRWAAVQTARSACAAMSVPYTEGFEDAGALSCWTSMGTAPTRNTQYHYAGSASCKITDGTAISPEMNVTSLATYMLTGQVYTTNDSAVFTVGVMVDPSDNSTYIDLGTVTVPARNTWTEFTTYFTLLTDPDYSDFDTAKHFALVADASTTIYVDDLYLGPTPTCPKPTEISVTNVLANTFDISWTNNAIGCTQWIVRATPLTAGQQTISQVVTTNPATITGLNSSSAYSIAIAAICSATDTSLWAQAGNITTACDIVNAPYEETFEFMTAGETPNCWDISASTTSTATGSSSYYVWGVFEASSNKSIRMSNWHVQSGLATINSPIIALDSAYTYTLYFDYCHQANCGALSVDISSDGGTTWNSVGTYSSSSTGSYSAPGTFTTIQYGLNTYSGSNIMIRFSATSNYGSGAIFVDNVKVQQNRTCATPENLTTVTAAGSNSVQVTWDPGSTETSWIVRTQNGTTVNDQVVTTNPYTITGLNAATGYTIRVAALCGVGDTSYFSAPISITTACAVVTLPYTEDFESQTVNTVPNCWDNTASSSSTATSSPYYVWGVYQTGGNNMIRMYNWGVQSGTAIIETPLFGLTGSANGFELKFDYCHQASCGAFTFDISTDNGSTWTTLGTYTGTSGSYSTPASWTTVTFNLSAYTNDTVKFRYNSNANWGSGAIFVDNLRFKALRSCSDPQSIRLDVGATDATVFINDTASAHSQWQYMYGAAGFDTTTANHILITTDTIYLTGLTASTAYDVYVRAYCDSIEQSNWIMSSFSTTSQPAAFPYVCHFTDATENSQWQYMSNGGSNAFTIGADANALNTGETAALYVANGGSYTYSTSSSSQALAYRLFRFQPSQYTLHFSWKCTGGESSWDYGRFYLLPATSAPTLPPSGSFNSSNWPSNMIALDGGTKKNLTSSPVWNDVDMTLDMTNQSGSYYLVFAWVNDGSAGTTSYPLAINDVEISELTCLSPANITIPAATITTNSAVVTYQDINGGSGTVRYWYNTTGSRTDTANIATATGTTINLTGLSASQTYYFFMQTVCSATDQSPIASTSFKTACGAINTFPFTEGFEGTEFEPNCWTKTASTSFNWSQYSTSYSSSYIHGGSHSAYVSGSTYTTGSGTLLATPQFEFDSLREYSVKFYMYRTTGTYITDEVKVYLSRTPNTIAGATLLGTTTVGSATTAGMNEVTYDLPMYTDGGWYIIFSGDINYSTYSKYIYIDDITVDIYPTCRDLTADPTVLSTTATTMTVTAPKGPNHQGIIFAYAPSTATSVADTVGSVYSTTGTATIQGLTNSTTYKVYARGVCSATDSTAWTDAATGTTMASDCFEPQNLRLVGLIGATDVAFTWGGAPDADFYECQWGTVTDTVYTDTIFITGLTPKTAYTFQVRGNCTGSTTNWVTYSFTTSGVPATLPYVCDFETQSESNMWEYVNDVHNYFIVGNDVSNGGSSSLYITDNGSTNDYDNYEEAVSFATRLFQLPAGQYAYSFDWNCYGESGWDYGRAFIVPDNATMTAGTLPSGISYGTGTPSGWISLDNNSQLNYVSSWQTQSGTFTITTGGNYLLTFLWRDDSSGGTTPPLAIDNIQLQQLTCPAPTLTVLTTTITQSSADVFVTNTNTSDTLIYAVSTGSLAAAFLTDTIVGDTLHLDSLPGSSTINVFVKVHCGAGDESMWANTTFRTLCGQAVLPYTEGFETVATSYSGPGMIQSICWDDLNATTSTYSYPRYNGSTSYVTEGSRSLYLNGSSTTALYLIMPSFGNFGNCRLTYDVTYESATSSGTVYAGYMTNPTDASTFNLVHTGTRSTSTASVTVDFANVPAGARLAFKYANGSSNWYAWLDNIRVSQLVQGPQYTDTICYNSPYTNHGFNVAATDLVVGDNNLSRLIAGSAGAPDTMVTATVTMRNEIRVQTDTTLCQGVPLVWHGYTITTPQSRTYTLPQLTSVDGCDSIVALNVTIAPTFSEVYDSICQGNVYTFRGVNYTQTNDYTIVGQNPQGCLDTVILHLYVVPTHSLTNAVTCVGESYQWHGNTYTQSGTYYWSGTGAFGCTQTDTLILSVSGGSNTTGTICQGGSMVFGTQTITQAGTYYNTYYDPYMGCSLTDTITVTVTPAKTGHVYGDACEGIPYMQYGVSGIIVTADTVIRVDTKDVNLCDSTGYVHITYHPTEYSDTDAYIKAGESFTWYNNTYNKAGEYVETLQTIHGCDSVVTLRLHVSGSGVDNVSDINIDIVPNPVNAGATAFVYGNFGEAKSVEILNNFGQVIEQFEPKSYPIEVSGITAAGLYYVRITTVDGEVHLQKLVVK